MCSSAAQYLFFVENVSNSTKNILFESFEGEVRERKETKTDEDAVPWYSRHISKILFETRCRRSLHYFTNVEHDSHI